MKPGEDTEVHQTKNHCLDKSLMTEGTTPNWWVIVQQYARNIHFYQFSRIFHDIHNLVILRAEALKTHTEYDSRWTTTLWKIH